MNRTFLLLSIITLIISTMKISPRKEMLTKKYGWIISANFSGNDNLWIFNLSCYQCLIRFSCHSLNLCSYHSIVFTSSFQQISSDATFRNYSQCPYQFVVSTDDKGIYYVYYFFFYSKSKDLFNISYSVIDDNRSLNGRNIQVEDKCREPSLARMCEESTETRVFFVNDSSRIRSYEEDSVFASRFMHAIVQVDSVFYVHGGLSSRNIKDAVFIRFSNNLWDPVPVHSSMEPPCLYSHTMSYYHPHNELILYGGIICGSKSTFSNTVWIFAIDSGQWQSVNSKATIPVIGHTSHIYTDIMFSFFGLTKSRHSDSSLTSSVRRFNLTTRQWMDDIILWNQISNNGLMYHCSVHIDNQIWVFGGLYPSQSTKLGVSSRLYSFNLSNNEWAILSDNGPRLYLHACVTINKTLITLGGLRLDEGTIEYRYHVEFSQSLASSLYYYNQGSVPWSMTYINYTNMGHVVSTVKDHVLVLIGGKATSFNKGVTLIKQETCTGSIQQSSDIVCQPFTYDNLHHDLSSALITTDHCKYTHCDTCTHRDCVWCPLTQLCMSKLQFVTTYAIGGCDVHILYESKCPVKCEHLSNGGCTNCAKLAFCGWCEFRSSLYNSRHLSGFGKCVEGDLNGPSMLTNDTMVSRHCKWHYTFNNWHFLSSKCPSCNCNGHAACLSPRNSIQSNHSIEMTRSMGQCSPCQHNTTGTNCQDCKEGHQGLALNGKRCTQCKCVRDKLAGSCNVNGICDGFCIEKGRIGNYCEDCDMMNNFTHFGDMCVFRGKINFQYILDKKTDHFNPYTNRVNFLLADVIPNMDLHFKIRCLNSRESLISVDFFNETGHRHVLMKDKQCLGFETLFPKSLFKGLSTYQLLFQVTGFQNASAELFQLEVIFTQRTYINLPYIFISFFACLSASVLSFYAVYKLRQHINRRTQAYRTLFVMERPFAKLQLAVNNPDNVPTSSSSLTINRSPTKVDESLSHLHIPIISVEPLRISDSQPCDDVIVSVLFGSPRCSSSSPNRTSPRILIGSAVTKISKLDRKLLLELPTKTSSGTRIMVDKDFDTSVSPSAAEELLTTEV